MTRPLVFDTYFVWHLLSSIRILSSTHFWNWNVLWYLARTLVSEFYFGIWYLCWNFFLLFGIRDVHCYFACSLIFCPYFGIGYLLQNLVHCFARTFEIGIHVVWNLAYTLVSGSYFGTWYLFWNLTRTLVFRMFLPTLLFFTYFGIWYLLWRFWYLKHTLATDKYKHNTYFDERRTLEFIRYLCVCIGARSLPLRGWTLNVYKDHEIMKIFTKSKPFFLSNLKTITI